MMPSIRLPDSDYGRRARSAFGRAGRARELDVWIDTATIELSPDLDHLLSFAGHPAFNFVTTTPVEGILTAELTLHNGQAGAKIEKPNGPRWLAGGPVETWEAITDRWAPGVDAARREKTLTSLLWATVADRKRADVLVTGTAVVREKVRNANGMSVEEALATVGLFLRSQDDFTVSRNSGVAYNRGVFYWLLARELVPSWGPVWRALVPHGVDGTPNFLNGLGHALIVRVDYVLRARDRSHFELKLPQDNDTADEFLFALDALLVAVDACFDVVARVLNRHHGLGSDNGARWRSDRWVGKLLVAAPTLEPAVGPGSLLEDLTTLVGGLRRSLHGIPLQTIANRVGTGGRDIENLFVVPPDEQDAIGRVLRDRGGQESWGIRDDIDDLLFVDPGRFVEVLSRAALEAIENVVASAVGPDAVRDRRGDWGDTPRVRRQLRALSGTVSWNAVG